MGKGADTQRRIVQRGMELASTVGLEGLTLGVLADALHVSKSGLFAHFKSKEVLQLSVLQGAVEQFVREVVAPALTKPRGEPRIRELFENWLRWAQGGGGLPGGCIFVTASVEFDDRTGPVRDALVQSQKDWRETLARAAQIAVSEKHFRQNLDPEQFAHELYGIFLGFHHAKRLLREPKAERLTRCAFEGLMERARRPAP